MTIIQKALVADDSMLSRMVLAKHLKELYPGVEIEQAENGAKAVALFEQWEVDVKTQAVFLDFMMPELNGFEALEKIRAASPDIRAYIVTANIQDRTKVEADRLGCTAMIHKTMKIEDLRRILGA